MEWLEVSIETTREGIDPVCARLIAMGIEGMQIEDFDDFQEFLEQNRKYWDYVDEALIEQKRGATNVKIYLPSGADGMERVSLVRSELEALRAVSDVELGSLEVTVDRVQESDWENEWKQYYHPTPVGERLLILPEWEERPATDRVVFINNPGMSFGTGTHASTRLALEAVERETREGDRVLDLGCGSGILAICALLLGAESADGVDIDRMAADISVENAARNHVDDRYRAFAGDVIGDPGLLRRLDPEARGYRLVFANIVADVIIRLPAVVLAALAPDGRFISSGIIEPRLDEVLDALRAGGLEPVRVGRRDGWCCVEAVRG